MQPGAGGYAASVPLGCRTDNRVEQCGGIVPEPAARSIATSRRLRTRDAEAAGDARRRRAGSPAGSVELDADERDSVRPLAFVMSLKFLATPSQATDAVAQTHAGAHSRGHFRTTGPCA